MKIEELISSLQKHIGELVLLVRTKNVQTSCHFTHGTYESRTGIYLGIIDGNICSKDELPTSKFVFLENALFGSVCENINECLSEGRIKIFKPIEELPKEDYSIKGLRKETFTDRIVFGDNSIKEFFDEISDYMVLIELSRAAKLIGKKLVLPSDAKRISDIFRKNAQEKLDDHIEKFEELEKLLSRLRFTLESYQD